MGRSARHEKRHDSLLAMPNCFDLTDRVAVVVGGTSGIGQAIAAGLEQHGARVIASGRSSALYPVDVTSRQSLETLRDKVGPVDILINAAGQTFRKPTLDTTELEWTRLIDITLTGMLRASQVFYEPLKASGRGRVVNIASLSS